MIHTKTILAKGLRFLTALCLFTSLLSSPASAYTLGEASTWDLPEAGLTITIPDIFLEAAGQLQVFGGYEIDEGSGVYVTIIYYTSLSREEYDELNQAYARTHSQDLQERFNNATIPLFYIVTIDGGRGEEEVTEALFGLPSLPEGCQYLEAGSFEDYNTYLLMMNLDVTRQELEDHLGDYTQEYLELRAMTEDYISSLDLRAPEPPRVTTPGDAVIGTTISFASTDMEGNPVSSEELFSANTFTLVNIWASWCPPCKAEMPELQKLYQEYKAAGVGFLGIMADGNDDDAIAVMEGAGVTYPCIHGSEDIRSLLPLTAYPTTYFVDAEGVVVGRCIVGAYLDAYREQIEALLAQ